MRVKKPKTQKAKPKTIIPLNERGVFLTLWSTSAPLSREIKY